MEVSEFLDRRETASYQLYPGVEMMEYDFSAERQSLYSTNLVESTAHLVKGCLGAGILGMHEAYMYGGIWTSLGTTLIIGFLVPYCMSMLVKSAQKMYVMLRVPRLSYPDLAEAAVATAPLKYCRKFSKAFRYLVDLFLFIEFNGTCCVFEIMVAKTLKQFIEAVTNLQFSLNIYILVITLPLMVLSMIRSLKYLAPFSLVADIFVAFCVLTTMCYSINLFSNLSDRPAWKSVHGWFRFCGVCIYSIDGIGVTLPIENNMKRPQYFSTVLQCGMTLVIALVTIVGFFGYWAWGEKCRSPFTIHMPSNVALLIMQGLLIASLAVTFAVHFWVPFRIIWHYIGKKYKKKRGVWERIHRLLHVLLISCLTLAVPDMSNWMSFIGNFFIAFMVFIIPSIIDTLISLGEPKKGCRWSFLKNACLIALGVVLCGGAFYSSNKKKI